MPFAVFLTNDAADDLDELKRHTGTVLHNCIVKTGTVLHNCIVG